MLQGRRQQQVTADLWARAGELEKQFASYKQKVDKTDQTKDESTFKEKKERRKDARGELYERYMKIRDVKLREGWIAKMEQKEEEMNAMWDQLEKTHTEMAVRFGGGKKVGPVPVRNPSAPLVPRSFLQRKDLLSEDRKGRDLTPRTSNTNTITNPKRPSSLSRNSTPSNSNSRPSSTSRNSTVPLSPRRSNPNRAQSLPRVESPSRSPAIFLDLKKDSSNKSPITPRTTRVLTKSQSSVMKGSQKPPRVSTGVAPRVSRSGSFDLKMNDQIDQLEDMFRDEIKGKDEIALEEMLKDEIKGDEEIALEEMLKNEMMEMSFEPIISMDDDLLPLSDNDNEVEINKETDEEKEEEIPSERSSLSHDSNSNNHIEPDSPTNVNLTENLETFTPPNEQVETETEIENLNLINPPMDKTEESSNESTRSWYSNLESASFSNRSTVDPAIDSPILSPRGSSSFRFVPEPTPIRIRKKWEARSTNSPRGIKKLLSFGRKSRGSETLTVDSASVLDDESSSGINGINRMSWASNESNGSRVSEFDNGDRASVYQAHASPGCLSAYGMNFDQKTDDQSSVNSQKVHRSFFYFPPFLCKGTESRMR